MSRLGRATLAAVALALGVAALAAPAAAESRVECKAVESRILGRAVRYCVLLPASYDLEPARRFPALYLLHGLGGSEQMLVEQGIWSLVDDLYESKRIGEFLVIAPDGGRSFYVNSRDGRNRYEDFFLREFLPAMDRAYRTRPERGARGVAGLSMGGYGALRFAFKYPDRFVSVSAHAAALMEELPRGAASAGQLSPALAILAGPFGSPIDATYYRAQSPFTLARQAQGLNRLKIYFDCGADDGYGFDAGARALSRLLTSRGVAHEFRIVPGGHDWRYFAAQLPATFEFHSRAFGLTPRP
jgi:S-formylglutathione hydrolase FrmB